MVATGHYLTSMAAMRMLLSGGNAFDAAAAAGFAAAVVEPTSGYTLGSEAPIMMYHAPTRELRVLSGQGVAPGRATVNLFREKGLDKIPTGAASHAALSFTVPDAVDTFLTLLETYGTKTVGEVMAPAIDYAQRGFPMWELMRLRLQDPDVVEQFKRYPPGGIDEFYPGGRPHNVGDMVVQQQLATTLRRLVEAESDAAGSRIAGIRAARDMFYRADIGRSIVQCSERVGGLFSLDDMANYRARFEEPITTTYMGHQVHAQSTWTQGVLLLQALNILEHYDLGAMGHNSVQYIHTVAEAIKLAFADRERYYGDPEFVSVPIEGLVSKEYAATRARLMRTDEAWPELPEAGDPWSYCNGAHTGPLKTGAVATAVAATSEASHVDRDGTTYLSVVDRDGNMVCATPSGATLAKSVFFPELGFAFSTRSEMFFLDDQHPNGLQPGKRPRTTLVNYIVCKDGQSVMTVGCPGGDNQPQACLQLMLNVMVFGMDPQQAVEAPRFSSQSVTNSFFPRVYLPGQLNVESEIAQDVRSELRSMGHKVVEASSDPLVNSVGHGAIVIERDPDTRVMSAGADPRRTTYAIGW